PRGSLCSVCSHAPPCWFFFFQAEDGIRDFHVTGVQTYALPIWFVSEDFSGFAEQVLVADGEEFVAAAGAAHGVQKRAGGIHALRSEERRVGKSGSHGWWPTAASRTRDTAGGARDGRRRTTEGGA